MTPDFFFTSRADSCKDDKGGWEGKFPVTRRSDLEESRIKNGQTVNSDGQRGKMRADEGLVELRGET